MLTGGGETSVAETGTSLNILRVLREIDRRAEHDRQRQGRHPGRVWAALMTAGVCLLMLHYLKYNTSFLAAVQWLAEISGHSAYRWTAVLRGHEYGELFGYLWWGAWHLLCFLLIPMALIRFGFRERLRDWGWQWGEVHVHWRGYLLLLLPVMLFAVLASFRQDFADHYPFYDQARRSWSDLLAWEAIYILQFVGVEFFFRGFLVNALRVPLGSLSVAVMCLPYLMLHFPKPWLEATGALAFGFFLGVLALQSRSIWGGVLVHVGVALSMDIAAMARAGGLPDRWFPL